MWYVDPEKGLTDSYFLENRIEKAMSRPFPDGLWRIDKGVNGGRPYTKLMGCRPVPIDMWSLKRKNTISVYSAYEKQNGFKHNGLAILRPSKCTTYQEMNGRWDCTLTHPIDEWGRWKYLLPSNVLKIRGQLFRIDRIETSAEVNSQSIEVHAKHIWYDLADRVLYKEKIENETDGKSQLVEISAQEYINNVFSRQKAPQWEIHYDEPFYAFQGSSDIEKKCTFDINNSTLASALIGDSNCLINQTGGELYRNNFYFSINQRMENAKDNAFSIRYGADMVKVKQILDWTDAYSYTLSYDNYGNMLQKAWIESGDLFRLHHHRMKIVEFNYKEATDKFWSDANAWFDANCYPKITYEVEIANIKDDPKYKDFVNLQDYEIGYSGKIYIEQFDISTEQKIIAIETDELTNNKKITLGNMKNSWIRPNYQEGVYGSGSAASQQLNDVRNEIKLTRLRQLTSWNSAVNYTWDNIKEFTWDEVKYVD